MGRGAWLVIALGGAEVALGAACASLPPENIPPYDASAGDGASADVAPGDTGTPGVDATLDALAESGPLDSASADAGNVDAAPDAPLGTLDAAFDTGSPDAEQLPTCDGGCVAYVVNDTFPDGGAVSVISTGPLAVLATIPVGLHPSRLAFTPDGSKAYVAVTGDGTVSVIDTASRQVTKTLPVASSSGASVRSVTVSPDGLYAFVSDGTANVVRAIDTSTDTLTSTQLPVSATGPYGLAFSPDGGELWAGGAGGNGVQRFAYPSLSGIGSIAGAGGSMLGDRIVFRPDFSAAFVNSGCGCCGELEDVSPAADAAVYSWGWYTAGYGLALSSDATQLFVTTQLQPPVCSVGIAGAAIWVLDATTSSFSQLNNTSTYDEPRGLAVSADGKTLFVAGYWDEGPATPGVTAYDATTLAPIGQPLAMPGNPQDIVMAP